MMCCEEQANASRNEEKKSDDVITDTYSCTGDWVVIRLSPRRYAQEVDNRRICCDCAVSLWIGQYYQAHLKCTWIHGLPPFWRNFAPSHLETRTASSRPGQSNPPMNA